MAEEEANRRRGGGARAAAWRKGRRALGRPHRRRAGPADRARGCLPAHIAWPAVHRRRDFQVRAGERSLGLGRPNQRLGAVERHAVRREVSRRRRDDVPASARARAQLATIQVPLLRARCAQPRAARRHALRCARSEARRPQRSDPPQFRHPGGSFRDRRPARRQRPAWRGTDRQLQRLRQSDRRAGQARRGRRAGRGR